MVTQLYRAGIYNGILCTTAKYGEMAATVCNPSHSQLRLHGFDVVMRPRIEERRYKLHKYARERGRAEGKERERKGEWKGEVEHCI